MVVGDVSAIGLWGGAVTQRRLATKHVSANTSNSASAGTCVCTHTASARGHSLLFEPVSKYQARPFRSR